MKILYLCSWYRNNPEGVSGIFFAEQAAVFAEKGHDVALACCGQLSVKKMRRPRFWKSSKEALTANVNSSVYRGEAITLPRQMQGVFKKTQNQCMSRGHETFLHNVIRDFGKPDLVHVQSALYAGIYGYQWLVDKRIPYIVTEHASFYRRGLVNPLFLPRVKNCFANSSRGIVVSRSLKKDLVRAGVDSPLQVVPNIYNGYYFKCATNRDKANEFTFLLVGGLDSNKGVDLAIKATSILRIKLPNIKFKLAIAGDGPERYALEQLVKESGLIDSVNFHGQCSREEVAGLMVKSHCLLSASYTETFGVNIIEGLATGLPVIATRSGGPEDFIKEPYGELVPTGDANELSSAMVKVIESYDYNDSAFRERSFYAEQHFSSEALYSSLYPIYERTIEASNRMSDEANLS